MSALLSQLAGLYLFRCVVISNRNAVTSFAPIVQMLPVFQDRQMRNESVQHVARRFLTQMM